MSLSMKEYWVCLLFQPRFVETFPSFNNEKTTCKTFTKRQNDVVWVMFLPIVTRWGEDTWDDFSVKDCSAASLDIASKRAGRRFLDTVSKISVTNLVSFAAITLPFCIDQNSRYQFRFRPEMLLYSVILKGTSISHLLFCKCSSWSRSIFCWTETLSHTRSLRRSSTEAHNSGLLFDTRLRIQVSNTHGCTW